MAMSVSFYHNFLTSCNYHSGKLLNPTTHLPQKSTGTFVWFDGVKNPPRFLYTRRIFRVQALYSEPKRTGDFNGRMGFSRPKEVEEEEKPWRLLRDGRKFYLDELDIVTILDTSSNLTPFNRETYNPAAYLWKKIGDIPEERRHRLFNLLRSRHIRRLWAIAGMRNNDGSGSLNLKHASAMLPLMENKPLVPEYWSGKINGVPLPIAWMRRFRKALFLGKEGHIYGRILPGGFLTTTITNYLSPLYFLVRNVSEVMATEEPCDLAFEFGNGQLQLVDLPASFPKPAKHPWPFNDQLVAYVRPAGPSVLVGQVWQEGTELEQVPQKFLGEFLLIKDYTAGEARNAASTTT